MSLQRWDGLVVANINNMETKKTYMTPSIELIILDNEISLALESNPPVGPDEVKNNLQNPFRDEMGLA